MAMSETASAPASRTCDLTFLLAQELAHLRAVPSGTGAGLVLDSTELDTKAAAANMFSDGV